MIFLALIPTNSMPIEVYTVYEVKNSAFTPRLGGVQVYYEVYIDNLFLVNFVMNLLCLELTNLTYHRLASRRRVVAGAAFGAVCYLIPFLLSGPAGFRMVCGLACSAGGMLWITFRPHSPGAFVCACRRLFLGTFLLGGGILFLIRLMPGLRRFVVCASGILGIGILLFLEVSYLVEKSGKSGRLYPVELLGKGSSVGVKALLDTGNGLVEPISGEPVCILERGAFDKLWRDGGPEGFRVIPYHSIGKSNGILSGYRIPEMRIEIDGMIRKRRNVYVGVSEEQISGGGNYAMILNPRVLKEE